MDTKEEIFLGMTTEQDGDRFHYPISIPIKKIHPHLIPKSNGYLISISTG